MPVSAYYKGKGSKVMSDMKKRYGSEKGKRVFYATAKERGQEPNKKSKRSKRAIEGLKNVKHKY